MCIFSHPLLILLRNCPYVLCRSMTDGCVPQHITIEDALCHRTGYPRHDLSIANDTVELIRSFRHLPLSAEPRTKFQ